MRLLLVEDDPMIGSAVEQGLRDAGFAIDWVRDGDAAELALRSAAYGLHKSWGLMALGLVLLRMVWRWRNPPPPALAGGFEAVLARVVHRGLYLMLLLAPLAGYLASSFTPYAVKLFGVELPRLGWPDEALNGAFKAVHVFAVWAIAGLVGLHVAGALKHAIQRDGTLSRMLPGWLLRN